jgi:DNA-binding CsgD family transcriptional regulator
MVGRAGEREALDLLLDGARNGTGGALVLRGEPGIGKTTLLQYARGAADDMRILSAAGVEAEQGLLFGNLHRLLDPLLGRIADLSQPDHDALESALERDGGTSTTSFSAAGAALSLVTLFAEAQPVLCLIDDVEWLDEPSEHALAFVSRRISTRPIALLFAARESAEPRTALEGLPQLMIEGLPAAEASELLMTFPGLGSAVRDRILAVADGNPLALEDLPLQLTAAQLGGVSDLPEPLPLGGRLERSFVGRVRSLPADTQTLLLLFAADRFADEDLIWRAADELAIDSTDADPAVSEGLLAIGTHASFRHPFIRSAVYWTAPVTERRRVHAALAAATVDADLDRRAWHLGASVPGPDETVALELERTADRAKQRVGYSAMASALEHSAQLTPDAGRRADRLLSAGWARLAAGDLGYASALLGQAMLDISDEQRQVKAQRLEGALAAASGDDTQSSLLLLQAALAFEHFDRRLARETHLEALESAMYAGQLGPTGGLRAAAGAARRAPPLRKSKMTGVDFLLDGYATRFTDGRAAAVPALRRGIDALRHRGEVRWLGLAHLAAWELWDDEAIHALTARRVRLARAMGARNFLPGALTQRGGYEVLVGRFDAADGWFSEARAIAAATGNPGIMGATESGALILAAWRGQQAETRRLAEVCKRDAVARGQGAFVNVADCAVAVLAVGKGRYDAALTAAQEARAEDALWSATRALPELIEAAARTRKPAAAHPALEELEGTARATRTEWALGMLARSRALLAADSDAEALYLEAIGHLKLCRVTPELARAHLLYGEWLRRRRRRLDAREQLTTAVQSFTSMGATSFAERASNELLATGERARRGVATQQVLTPQEWRIAKLVTDGGTNADIAAQLYVSPRTVEYHLRKVFRKLGLSSRTQLARELLESSRPVKNA